MKITTVEIDLAKNVFQVYGVDDHGKSVLRKKLDRSKMPGFFIQLQPCLIGMEACGSAHYWARKTDGPFNRLGQSIAPRNRFKPRVNPRFPARVEGSR